LLEKIAKTKNKNKKQLLFKLVMSFQIDQFERSLIKEKGFVDYHYLGIAPRTLNPFWFK
jgi:hypothetical protein